MKRTVETLRFFQFLINLLSFKSCQKSIDIYKECIIVLFFLQSVYENDDYGFILRLVYRPSVRSVINILVEKRLVPHPDCIARRK